MVFTGGRDVLNLRKCLFELVKLANDEPASIAEWVSTFSYNFMHNKWSSSSVEVEAKLRETSVTIMQGLLLLNYEFKFTSLSCADASMKCYSAFPYF